LALRRSREEAEALEQRAAAQAATSDSEDEDVQRALRLSEQEYMSDAKAELKLVAMGFDAEAAESALKQNGGSLERAAEDLGEHPERYVRVSVGERVNKK